MSTVVAHPLVSICLAFVVGRAVELDYAIIFSLPALMLGFMAERFRSGRFLTAHILAVCAGLSWPSVSAPPCEESERRVQASVEAVRLTGSRRPQSVDLRVEGRRVRAALAPQPRVLAGDRIEVVLALERFDAPANPSDFDAHGWAKAAGYACRGHYASAHGFLARQRGFVRDWHRLRQRTYDSLERLHEPARSIVRALALGARGEMPPELRERWSRAGLAHLLAISGLHITLVAGAVFLLLKLAAFLLARRGRVVDRWSRWAQLTGVGCALIYCAWVGAPMSARRAALMLTALALARIDGDRISPIDALASVLLILVLIDRGAVQDIGLWLSVSAVASLVSPKRGTGEALIAPAIATAPLVAMSFRSVAWLSPIANALAIPLASFVLTPLALLVAVVPASAECDSAVLWVVEAFDLGAEVFADFDSPCSRVPWVVAGVEATLGIASAWMTGRWRWGMRLWVVLGLVWGSSEAPAASELSVQYIAVGQGDSTLVRFPSGEAWLIDGGGRVGPGRFDPGARHVVPALLDAGVRRLDVMIATHGDADHIQGLHAVLDRIPVRLLFWNGRGDAGMAALLEHAAKRGVDCEVVHRRVRWVETSRVELRVLSTATNQNDASIVTVIQHGGTRLVWPGDIGARSERFHLDWVGRVNVLLAAHHGSKTSSSSPWLRALSPAHVVVSVGEDNRYGMPHAEVLSRIRKQQATLWRLDHGGQMRLESEGASVSLFRAGRVR